MAGVVICMEANEVSLQHSSQDLLSDWQGAIDL